MMKVIPPAKIITINSTTTINISIEMIQKIKQEEKEQHKQQQHQEIIPFNCALEDSEPSKEQLNRIMSQYNWVSINASQ